MSMESKICPGMLGTTEAGGCGFSDLSARIRTRAFVRGVKTGYKPRILQPTLLEKATLASQWRIRICQRRLVLTTNAVIA